jgi:hypothetical protein
MKHFLWLFVLINHSLWALNPCGQATCQPHPDLNPNPPRGYEDEGSVKIQVDKKDWDANVFPNNFPAEYTDYVSFEPEIWLDPSKISSADEDRLADIIAYKQFYPHLQLLLVVNDISYFPSSQYTISQVENRMSELKANYPDVDGIDFQGSWEDFEATQARSFYRLIQNITNYRNSELLTFPSARYHHLQIKVKPGQKFPPTRWHGAPNRIKFFQSSARGSFTEGILGGIIWDNTWSLAKGKIGYRTTEKPVFRGLRSFKQNRNWINSQIKYSQNPHHTASQTIDLSITGFKGVPANPKPYITRHSGSAAKGSWSNNPYFSWTEVEAIRNETSHSETDETYGAHSIWSKTKQQGLWLEWLEEKNILNRLDRIFTEQLSYPRHIINTLRVNVTTIKGLSGDVDDNYRRLKTTVCGVRYYLYGGTKCQAPTAIPEIHLAKNNSSYTLTGYEEVKLIISKFPKWNFNDIRISFTTRDGKRMDGEYELDGYLGNISGWYQSVETIDYYGQQQYEIIIRTDPKRKIRIRWWAESW